MKHLGGMGLLWFMLSGYSGPHTWLSTHGMCWFSSEGTLVVGHPETKRLQCLPYFSELLVQPYDNMGSILTDYAMRIQHVCKTLSGRKIIGGGSC
jgi:hypothetical protein